MKRFLPLAVIAASVLLLAGCEPQKSLFPLFTDQDKLFDKQLLGEWKIWSGTELKAGEKPALIIFNADVDGYTYDVKIPKFGDEGNAILTSRARLVKLGNSLFVDFSAPELDNLTLFPYPAVESHVFGRLSLEKDKARIDLLSDDWVQDSIKAGKLTLADVPLPNPVLSASTADLREFVVEHAEDQKAFSETFTMVRSN